MSVWKKTQCGGAEPLCVASVWMKTQREGETPSRCVCVERDMMGGGFPTLVASKRKQHHSEEDLNPPCHIAISKEWLRAQTLLAVLKVEQHNEEALLVMSRVLCFRLFRNVLSSSFHDLPWSSTLCHLLHHMHSIHDAILRHFECLLLFLLSSRLCCCTNSYAFPLMLIIAMPFHIWTLLVYINSR